MNRSKSTTATRKAFAILAATGKKPKPGTREMFAAAKINHDGLEQQCEDYAWLRHRIKLYKTDAEFVINKKGQKILRATSGIPDRHCVLPPTGRVFYAEIKTGVDTSLRRKQAAVHKDILKNGGVVHVISSFRQFCDVLDMAIAQEKQKKLILDQAMYDLDHPRQEAADAT